MFNKYYMQELQNLRDMAVEFSKVHPAIAPMLSGPTSDPDVERLLEGVAFLTGLLNQKLNDDFPELIHGLMNIIFPHYIRPIPSCSIVVFTPKAGMMEPITVRKGTSLGSIPVEATSCVFQTCFNIDVQPLRLIAAELLQQTGASNRIRLTLELSGPDLSQWRPKNLCFFLGGSYSDATDLFFILNRCLQNIVVRPLDEGSPCVFPVKALKSVGFDLENNVLPYHSPAFSGYRIIQEYFVLPRKFLFFELEGWDKWENRGRGRRFEIIFELSQTPIPPPAITPDHFILFGTPVINLFSRESDPFVLDHRFEKVRLQAGLQDKSHYQIYGVDRVVGYKQGGVAQREYVPLERFHNEGNSSPVYQVIYSRSPITNAPEVSLSFAYPSSTGEPERETISVTMTCTNGELPERLKLGDICRQTSDSPELLTFRNVMPLTSPIDSPIGENASWRFLSHLSLNFLSLADSDSIKELLRLYAFPEGKDRATVAANLKRIDSILDFKTTATNRLLRGMMVRGQHLDTVSRQDYFAGLGDLYLFGAVMDAFLGVYSSINTFTRFQLKDSLSGETFLWPPRMGSRTLI